MEYPDQSNYYNRLDLQKTSIHTEIRAIERGPTDGCVNTEYGEFSSLEWLVAEHEQLAAERDRLGYIIQANGEVSHSDAEDSDDEQGHHWL